MKMFEICKGIASECGRLLIVLLTGTIIACGIDSSLASAEVVTVEGTGTYTIGDGLDENLAAAKERARMEAMRNASEKAGVYVEGISVVKEGQLTHDEIKAITATIMQVQGEPHFKIVPVSDSVITYQCVVVVKVDTDQVTQKMLADRQALAESVKRNKELEEENKRLAEEMSELKRKYDNATSDKERYAIKQKVVNNDVGIWVSKWLEIANKFYNKKEYGEALNACNEAIAIDSNSPRAYYGRALSYWGLQEVDKALDDITYAIKLDSEIGILYGLRGSIYANVIKDYNKAILDYNKAIMLEPQDADWYNYRGWAYGNINEIGKALSDFDKAIDISHNYASAYLGRGRVYLIKNDIDKALIDLNRAISINKNNAMAYVSRGMVYGMMGEYIKSIADFTKGIELNSEDAWTYRCRAYAYTYVKEYINALNDYNKAISLDDKNAQFYVERGKVYACMLKYDEAITDFDKSMKINNKIFDAYMMRGMVYGNKGDWKRAIDDFNQCIKLESNDARGYGGRGQAYSMQKEYRKAIDDLDKAISMDSGNDFYYRARGWAKYMTKDYLGAVIDCKKALELNPNETYAKNILNEAKKYL